MLILEGLRERGVYKKVTGLDGLILKELEELPGGRPLEPRHERNVPKQQNNYSILVSLVKE